MRIQANSARRKQRALLALETLEDRTAPATLFGITGQNLLVRFDSATPGVLTGSVAVTGLVSGENVLGIDFRPTTGELFGLGNANLYTINPTTGVATLRAALTAAPGDDNPFTTLGGAAFGVGFNPVPDLAGNPSFRVVSNTGENLRINVLNGEVTTDANITPAGTTLTSVAYTNNDLDPATGTTIFAYDFIGDDLMSSANANGGVYADVSATDSGVVAFGNEFIGLDIETGPGSVNTAYLTLNVGAATTVGNLYTIDLTTGAATLVGAIGPAPTLLRSLTVAPAGSIQFSAPTYTVGESGPVATITVNRVGGSEGTVNVNFTSSNSSATAPGDYTDSDQVLVFGPGVTSQTVLIPINNDDFAEGNETIDLALASPTGGALLGPQATAVLTITDDDTNRAANVFGVTTAGNLVRFNIANPTVIVSSVPISGLVGGDNVRAIDFRPATGQLFALGSGGRLYTLDTTTGVATQVGAGTFVIPLDGVEFGFDFNPTVDRIRVVSDADQNLRLNPNDGSVVDFDTTTAGVQADQNLIYDNTTADGDPIDTNAGANPNVVGAAYLNSVNLATATTLYGIDTGLDILVTQAPPNNGVLNTVGRLGVDATDVLGFDLRGATNAALATLVVNSVPGLYSINLATGAATSLGPIGAALTVRGLAIAPEGFANTTLTGTTAVFNGGPACDTITFDQSGVFLRHNRFTAGDPGFNSDLDFDPTVAGDQTLSATDATATIIVNGGDCDDAVTIGSATSPASGLAAAFQIDGQGGGDTLIIENGADATARTITVNSTTGTVTGIGGGASHTALERVVVNAGGGGDTINLAGAGLALTNVNAGGGDDTVVFGDGATLSGGLLDGGAGTNTLDYTAYVSAITVNLAQTDTLFQAVLSGAQEPGPLSSSQGAGTGVFLLNAAQTQMTFDIDFRGLVGATVTGNHFHNAAAGVNGAIVRGLTPAEEVDITPPDGNVLGVWSSTDAVGIGGPATSGPLTPALVAELLAGRIYFNTHTNLFPSGELRGQLLSQGTVSPATGAGGVRGFSNATGGAGNDVLTGNSAVNILRGGPGADTGLGGPGADSFFGGPGNDTFTWNPGDGNDLFEGEADTDTHVFNGAAAAEVFTLNANGARFELLRSVGSIDMDLAGVEIINLNALGGNDSTTINSLTGTDVQQVNVLAGDGNDVTTAAGSVNTTVNVDGGPHVLGDVLRFNAANAAFVLASDRFTGAGQQPVIFTNIEDVAAVGEGLTADQRYVSALYIEFLGRSASPGERDFWVNLLPAQGREAVARGIICSQEGLGLLVNSYYVRFLNRSADADGLNFWIGRFNQGATEEQVVGEILGSDEFFARAQTLIGAGSPEERAVRALYLVLFNRTPTDDETSFWTSNLPTSGRTGVATAFLRSQEHRTIAVLSYYFQLVNRTTLPTADELSSWVNSSFDLIAIRTKFAASPEFFAGG